MPTLKTNHEPTIILKQHSDLESRPQSYFQTLIVTEDGLSGLIPQIEKAGSPAQQEL